MGRATKHLHSVRQALQFQLATRQAARALTTDANAMIAPIHDRMPVILGPEDWAAWLGEEPIADPAALLKPFPAERMTLWPVSKAVGNVKNQGRELAEPVAI